MKFHDGKRNSSSIIFICMLTIITFIADASSSSGMLSTISLQLHIKKDRAANSSKFRALKSISLYARGEIKTTTI